MMNAEHLKIQLHIGVFRLVQIIKTRNSKTDNKDKKLKNFRIAKSYSFATQKIPSIQKTSVNF